VLVAVLHQQRTVSIHQENRGDFVESHRAIMP